MIAKYVLQMTYCIVLSAAFMFNAWSECFYPKECTLFPTNTSKDNLRVKCQFIGEPPLTLDGGDVVTFCTPKGYKETGEAAPTGSGSSPKGEPCGDLTSYFVTSWKAFQEFKSPFLGGDVSVSYQGVSIDFPVGANQNCRAYHPIYGGPSIVAGTCGGNATTPTQTCPEN